MRRLIRVLASITMALGVLLLADAAITLVWQEPVSAVIAMIKRDHIDKRFLSYRSAPLSTADQRELRALDERHRIAFLAHREERQLRTGVAAAIVICAVALITAARSATSTQHG